MTVRSRQEFFEGLCDGRRVHYKGRLINRVLDEPDIRRAAERSAVAFDMQHDPALCQLTVDMTSGKATSAMYALPRTIEDLRRRAQLIQLSSRMGGCMMLLKEVGSDALFALLSALDGDELNRARAFYEHCSAGDLTIAVAQTDVKGDRSLPPNRQTDPDLYLHIVDEDSEHIVVRGAKCHTTFSAYVDELLVLPTRAMGPDDSEYAVSFAIPIATPGLELYVSPYLSGERNSFEHPLSSRFSILESLTVFNDVVIPRERVFLSKKPELAGPLALTFVNFHRLTAVGYKVPLADLVVGAAFLIAKANGITRASHVRDKLAYLVRWAETIRSLAQTAANRSSLNAAGLCVPEALTVNMAKFEFAHGYHTAIEILRDLAGGLLVTGPGGSDWEDPDTRAVMEKYFAAAVPAEDRLKIMNLITELVARDYGGYQSVVATHAEGSLEAEKLQLLRSYSTDNAVSLANYFAGLGDGQFDDVSAQAESKEVMR
ncbi:MAG: 4-hydroxyphenylacetate 3-hydroxylase N-terminal domain-containing protein [Alphaproteobacteria bacterium]